MTSKNRRWRVWLLGIVVSALSIWFIMKQVDFTLFGQAWAQARYLYIVPTVIFLLLGLVTRALRWRVLLSGALPLPRAFSMMNVAYLVNGVLPLRLGEVVRVFLATRVNPPVPWPKTTGTIIVERLLDLIAVTVLLALALIVGDVPPELRSAGIFTGLAALIGLFILAILAANRSRVLHYIEIVVTRLPILARFRLVQLVDHLLAGLTPLSDIPAVIQAMMWTGISWGLSVCAGYVLMFTFYQQASWSATALYIAAAAFAIALPAVPGSVGTYEAAILLALAALGYDTSSGTALAFAVLVHGINVLVHSATGFIGLLQEGISLSQLSRGVQEMRQQTSQDSVSV